MIARIAAAYGCPEDVAAAIHNGVTPLLAAIAKLTAARVQWGGLPPTDNTVSMSDQQTAWLLDGNRASFGDLLAAAAQVQA